MIIQRTFLFHDQSDLTNSNIIKNRNGFIQPSKQDNPYLSLLVYLKKLHRTIQFSSAKSQIISLFLLN